MNVKLIGTLIAVSLIACPILYIFVGPALDASQLEAFKLLGIICGCSALFCFLVGELTSNNSQMDKLWSILPIVLFLGSSAFAEEISSAKYPEYARYCRQVSRFFPGRRYQ